MALLVITDVGLAIILAAILGLLVGSFAIWVALWVPWHAGSFYETQVYQERDKKFYLVHRGRQALTATLWTLGKNFEFVIPSPAPVVFYINGRPVLQYLIDKARPRHAQSKDGKRVRVQPEEIALVTPPNLKKSGDKSPAAKGLSPDAESRSVNLVFRRGLIEAMAKGLNVQSLKGAIPLVILAALAALMVGYVLFLNVHPGLVQAPPPGYYYKALPIPTNSTGVVVH